MAQIRSKKKRKIKVGRLALVVGILLMVLGGLVYFGIKLFKPSGKAASLAALPFSAQSNYEYIGSGFLYQSGNSVNYVDNQDEKKNYSLSVSNADIKLAGGPNIAVVYSQSAMQIVDAPQPAEFTGTVLDVECGSSHAAVLHRSLSDTHTLMVYDAKGVQQDELSFEDQFLVDFGFYGETTDSLWTLTLDTTGSRPVSNITTYDMEKSATTGVLPIQNQLIENIAMTESSIFVVGTNNLIRYARSGNNETYRLLIYGWKLVDQNAKRGLFLFARRGEEGSTMRLYSVAESDLANEKLQDIQIPAGCIKTFVMDSGVVAVCRDKLVIIQQDGTVKEERKLGIAATDAVKLSATQLAVISGNSVYKLAV